MEGGRKDEGGERGNKVRKCQHTTPLTQILAGSERSLPKGRDHVVAVSVGGPPVDIYRICFDCAGGDSRGMGGEGYGKGNRRGGFFYAVTDLEREM
jgi:hypothetical protein